MSQIIDTKGYGERCLKTSTKEKNPENRRVDFWRADPIECLNDVSVNVEDDLKSENCKMRCETNKEKKVICEDKEDGCKEELFSILVGILLLLLASLPALQLLLFSAACSQNNRTPKLKHPSYSHTGKFFCF